MRTRILILAAIVVIGAVAFAVVRGARVEVAVAVATQDTLSVTIPAEGRTRARERFTITAPVSGRLTRLDLEEGDMVDAGQSIARLFPTPQDPRVIATAHAEVETAEARHGEAASFLREAELREAQAEREVARRRPLAEMGAITREHMEQAELAAVVARERREAAEAALTSARAAVTATRARLLGAETSDNEVRSMDIVAPVAGRVVSVPDESERVVPAGATLAVLAGIGGLEIVLDVLSEDAVRVKVGDEIVLTEWGGDEPLHGTVRTVTRVGYTEISALGVEEQRVDVVGDLHWIPESLGAGYRVSGEIVIWRGADVLTVPTSAIFRVGEHWRLFVEADGRVEGRDVVIGRRNEDAAVVVEGVSEGERVILFPPEAVGDGTAVRGTLQND